MAEEYGGQMKVRLNDFEIYKLISEFSVTYFLLKLGSSHTDTGRQSQRQAFGSRFKLQIMYKYINTTNTFINITILYVYYSSVS